MFVSPTLPSTLSLPLWFWGFFGVVGDGVRYFVTPDPGPMGMAP
jgi:hypothetical protein